MTRPLTPGWYTWAESSQSDHLIAHWFTPWPQPDGCETRCGLLEQSKHLTPAMFQRHCKHCARALAKETKKA